MTITDRLQQSIDEKVDTLKHMFADDEHAMLREMVGLNYNWDDEFTKDFDATLLSRYQKHSTLIDALNKQDSPCAGHIVKVVCQNGKVYEQALLRFHNNQYQITVNGGGFIHKDTLINHGLVMSVCGGYTLKVNKKHLSELDFSNKNFQFSGTGRVEADCAININKPVKRWLLDDTNGQLGFY